MKYKFRISSPEQSERLQKVLFELGFKWYRDKPTEIFATHAKFLTVGLYCERGITWGDQERYFLGQPEEEKDAEEFIMEHTKKQNVPHIHAKWIKLWADGVALEWRYADPNWTNVHPEEYSWNGNPERQYRIKPNIVKKWKWAYKLNHSNYIAVTDLEYTEDKAKTVFETDADWYVKLEPTMIEVEE